MKSLPTVLKECACGWNVDLPFTFTVKERTSTKPPSQVLNHQTRRGSPTRQQKLPLSPTSKTKAPHNNLSLICSFGSREGIVFPTRPTQVQILQILKSQKQKRFPLCGLWYLQVVNLNQQEPERSLI